MRYYTCTYGPTAATVAIDVFEFTPADDKPIILLGCTIAQTTEIKEAEEEQLEVKIMRGGTAMTSGSGGGAAANGVSVDASGATSGFTFENGNTTLATFTSGVTLLEDTFNVRVGWQYWPVPEARIACSQANGGFVIRMNSTPADSITFVATAYIGEDG